jgi:hypothetical protein
VSTPHSPSLVRAWRAVAALLVTIALTAVLAPAACAAGVPASHDPHKVVQPGDPGSSQYQEDVPSAFGNVPATSVSTTLPPPDTQPLPAAVGSQLHHDGAAGQAAAALALAGTPQREHALPAHRQPRRRSGHEGAGAGGGASSSGGGSAKPLASVAQAGSGKSVPASLVDSLTGSLGGIGALLPIALIASLLVVAAATLGRRRGSG